MNPSAIIISDIHLREDTPECRTDDYWKSQERKILFLKKHQQKYKCPVLHAGDLFHHWKPSPYLIRWTLQNLPNNFYTIPGQHDLPEHNLEKLNRSGMGVLEKAGKIQVLINKEIRVNNFLLIGVPFGEEIPKPDLSEKDLKRVLLIHQYIYQGEKPWPDCTELTDRQIMRKITGYDLTVSGDNHIPFMLKQKNRILLNPGSMMRMTADQINHKPAFYLWDAENNKTEPVYFKIKKEVVSRIHIKAKEEKEKRLDAFISRLNEHYEIGLSFEKNIKQYLRRNKTKSGIENKIWKIVLPER